MSRSDKGLILATERDLYCMRWTADQTAVSVDQAQRLLSRMPGGQMKDQRAGLAASTVKDQITRWRHAGWIEYRRILVGQPGWMWVTKKGLQLVGWEDFYRAYVPSPVRLNHLYAVNQVRLALDTQGYLWKSEREYRMDLEAAKGEELGPIPDAIIERQDKGTIAVEVELTQKKPADLRRKIRALVGCLDEQYKHKFPTIWFYAADEKIERAIEQAVEDLGEEERVGARVFPNLVR